MEKLSRGERFKDARGAKKQASFANKHPERRLKMSKNVADDKKVRLPKFRDAITKLVSLYGTQQKLADLIGQSRQTVGNYMCGERIPDVETLYNIADKCNVSADWLIGLSDVRACDDDIKTACRYTGLSEENAKAIRRINQVSPEWDDAEGVSLNEAELNLRFDKSTSGKIYGFNSLFRRCIEHDFFSALFDVLYEFEKVKERLDVKPTEGSSRRDYKKGAELISLDDCVHLMDEDWELALFRFQRACTRLIAEEDNELRKLNTALNAVSV